MKAADITKISVALYTPMFLSFEKQLEEAFIKRDAFLDHVIASEITHVRADLKGKRNSAKARRRVSDALRKLGAGEGQRTPVSIKVRKTTADALRELEDAHNLVRDALLNRIIMLLRASDKLLMSLGLPDRIDALRREGVQEMPTGPLRSMIETVSDPFYYLRTACEAEHDCGLYALSLPEPLLAMSCYLPDEEVPGTAANKRSARDAERMLEELAAFESALGQPAKKAKGGRHG